MELNFVIQDAENIRHMLELLDHCPHTLQVPHQHYQYLQYVDRVGKMFRIDPMFPSKIAIST